MVLNFQLQNWEKQLSIKGALLRSPAWTRTHVIREKCQSGQIPLESGWDCSLMITVKLENSLSPE